jgi:signal transduction histidine kinase
VGADRGRLAQVIFNLLDNSLKFTRPTKGKRKIYIVSEKKITKTVSIEEHGGPE